MRRAFSTIPVALLCAFVTCERAIVAELHPIVEVQTGYFFGTVSGGKWLKAAEDGSRHRLELLRRRSDHNLSLRSEKD
jgi:hypothetical protein